MLSGVADAVLILAIVFAVTFRLLSGPQHENRCAGCWRRITDEDACPECKRPAEPPMTRAPLRHSVSACAIAASLAALGASALLLMP
jgi:predicted amidophosphoribosyltransferase